DSESVLLVDHAFGYPFAAIAAVRRRHPQLLLIEDCARALGSEIDGRAVGNTADWTLLSLYKAVDGNDHGALLLTPSPYRIGTRLLYGGVLPHLHRGRRRCPKQAPDQPAPPRTLLVAHLGRCAGFL